MWAGYQVLTRLAARYDSPDTSLDLVDPRGARCHHLRRPYRLAMADRHGMGADGDHRGDGRRGALRPLQGARLRRGGAVQPYSYTLLVWAALLGAVVFATFPTDGQSWARPSSWRAVSTRGITTGESF